jgi:hypothetical protein
MSHVIQNRKARKGKKNQGKLWNTPVGANTMVHHSFQKVGQIMPAEVDVILPYTAFFNLLSTTNTVSTKPLVSNNAYDVDPNLGSVSTQGFAEWANFFILYRVVGYEYSIEVSNGNTAPMFFTILNSNSQMSLPNGIGTSIDLSPYANNPNAQSILLAGSGSSKGYHKFTKKLSISDVVGSVAPETEDNYRSLVTSGPTDLTYILMGVTSAQLGTVYVTNPVSVVVHLRMFVRFYERKQLTA